jgi:MacB-like periplasmic core domain
MRRILRYFRANRFEADLAAEVEAHVDEKIESLIAEGLTPEEARSRALREFGNRTQIAEESRRAWTFARLDEIGQDLRYALRMIRKSPGFTTVAVLSLALGIAANTIIFSAVSHVLLHSLPYPDAGRLLAVWSRSAAHGTEPMHVSAADFYDWQAQSQAFASLAAYANWPMNWTNVPDPRRLETQLVSPNLFSTLGVQAQLGRTFLPGEDGEQSAPVVVISHHLWRAMGEPADVVGRKMTLNGSETTVIGVMPSAFAFPSRETDLWTPLSLSAPNRTNREGRWLRAIGRLRTAATPRDAAAEMNVIANRLAAAYPATNTGWGVSLVPLQEEVVGRTRPILVALQAGALILLLVS